MCHLVARKEYKEGGVGLHANRDKWLSSIKNIWKGKGSVVEDYSLKILPELFVIYGGIK